MFSNEILNHFIHPSQRRGARRGSLIIECVIAAMLVTVASVGLLRLGRTASNLNRQANHRLAATLIAENIALRVQQIPFDQLATETKAAADQTAKETNSKITITTKSFDATPTGSVDGQGLHVTIEVRTGTTTSAVRHAWRFPIQPVPEPTDNVTESTFTTADRNSQNQLKLQLTSVDLPRQSHGGSH